VPLASGRAADGVRIEHDTAVLEYYDLPTTLHLHYTARSGKRAAVEMIPDFLVIRTDGAGFIECRSEPGQPSRTPAIARAAKADRDLRVRKSHRLRTAFGTE
jgi:hypothetical protein